MEERNRQNIVGIVLAVVLVVGFGLSRVLGGVMGEPGPTCDDPIAWHDAAREVGRQSAIVGPVVAASFEPDIGGAPTFLNLGNEHPEPDRFDVVIYDDVRERFDRPPEQVLVGEYVCVLGEVRDRDGVPQIILDSPGWLWIEEGPGARAGWSAAVHQVNHRAHRPDRLERPLMGGLAFEVAAHLVDP